MAENTPALIRLAFPNEFTHRSPDYRYGWGDTFCADYLEPVLTPLKGVQKHIFFGMDFGLTQHLSVIWLLRRLANLNLHTPLVLEMKNTPFEQQQQLLFYMLNKLGYFAAGAIDSRGNGQVIGQTTQQHFGPRVQQVMLSEGWYRDYMPIVKRHFEDGSLILPADADILSDLKMVRVEQGVAKIPKNVPGGKSAGKKGKAYRHGDTAVALALGVYAAQLDIETFDYEPVYASDKQQRPLWQRTRGHWRQ